MEEPINLISANELYFVVKNNEGQYSIWPEYKNIPAGWHIEGQSMTKALCLSYINEVWTDMRPLSLIMQMQSSLSDK